jgi:hypothetical protein
MVRTTATASLRAAPWCPCDLSASTLAAHVGRGSTNQCYNYTMHTALVNSINQFKMAAKHCNGKYNKPILANNCTVHGRPSTVMEFDRRSLCSQNPYPELCRILRLIAVFIKSHALTFEKSTVHHISISDKTIFHILYHINYLLPRQAGG